MKHTHHFNKRLFLIGLLLTIATMVMATQYAVTRVGYDFAVVHPSNADIRFVGSDNASDNIRLLRVVGPNSSNVVLRLEFGNFTLGQEVFYSAAFALVNEEDYPVNITYINVSAANWTCMRIWLHGDRDANANSTVTDPTSVLLYDNGTVVHGNRSFWTLAPGNYNATNMCSNVTDPQNHTIRTPWDETAHVRWTRNETNAKSNFSDYVWAQFAISIPIHAQNLTNSSGMIYFHFAADRT